MLQKYGLERGNKRRERDRERVCVWSDGSPPTALPVVEQIGPAAEHSDCRGDQASADRWLPPSIGHWAVRNFH